MTPMSMTILSAYADNSPPIGGEYEDEHHCFCAWLDPHPARQAANRRTGHEHYCDLQPQASRAPVHSFIDTRPGNQSSTERTHGALYRYDWLLFTAVHECILCLHALDDPGRYERRKPCSLNHSNKTGLGAATILQIILQVPKLSPLMGGRWRAFIVTSLVVSSVDRCVHPSHFSGPWAEALATGMSAYGLNLAIDYAYELFLSLLKL